jgi:hypothetical protein
LKLRGADPTGNGWYGADRSGGRKHKGIDIVAQPGERIFSPITGKITRSGLVYTFTRKFKLLVISNDIYEVKLMYMEPHPFNPGDLVYECAEIGINQDVANYWGKGMVNHIHMEVRKYGLLTDPEPLLIKPDWL